MSEKLTFFHLDMVTGAVTRCMKAPNCDIPSFYHFRTADDARFRYEDFMQEFAIPAPLTRYSESNKVLPDMDE